MQQVAGRWVTELARGDPANQPGRGPVPASGCGLLAEGGKPYRVRGMAGFEGRSGGLLHQVRTVDEVPLLDERNRGRLELGRYPGRVLQQAGPRREGRDQRLAQAAPF